jgi:hypothetical protein
MTKITLNRADIVELQNVLQKLDVNSFTLIKQDSSSVGYTLVIECMVKKDDSYVKVTVPVVGVANWWENW